MDSIIIAWDDDLYARHLEDFAAATEYDIRVALSKWEFYRFLRRRNNNARLVIPLELAWEGQRSGFYGFELVKELLQEGFDQTIVLCTFMDRWCLYDLEGSARLLARMPFPFERLPVSPAQLVDTVRSARPFSPMMWAYIREHYLAEEPISVLVHHIRQVLRKEGSQLAEEFSRATEDLDALNLSLPAAILSDRRSAEQALEGGDYEAARGLIKLFADRLERHGARKMADAGVGMEPVKADYAVILVEDDPVQLELYRKGLEPYFDVFPTRRAEEALRELEENPSDRRYLAIIADWELLEDDGRTWQQLQGFDLLAEAGKKHLICLVALTSLNSEAVRSILRPVPVKVHWFSKDEVGEREQWPFHAFAGYIRAEVDTLLADLVHLPDTEWWVEHGLRELFLDLRYHSGTWDQARRDFEEQAARIVEEYAMGKAVGPINKAPHKLTLPGAKNTNLKMGHLEKILIQRLVVLALYFHHRLNLIEVFARLRRLEDEESAVIENQIKVPLAQLGLSHEGFDIKASSVMEHERDWLGQRYEILPEQEEWEKKVRGGEAVDEGLATLIDSLFIDINDIWQEFASKTSRGTVGEIDSVKQAMEVLEIMASEVPDHGLERWLMRQVAEFSDYYTKVWEHFDYDSRLREIILTLQS